MFALFGACPRVEADSFQVADPSGFWEADKRNQYFSYHGCDFDVSVQFLSHLRFLWASEVYLLLLLFCFGDAKSQSSGGHSPSQWRLRPVTSRVPRPRGSALPSLTWQVEDASVPALWHCGYLEDSEASNLAVKVFLRFFFSSEGSVLQILCGL